MHKSRGFRASCTGCHRPTLNFSGHRGGSAWSLRCLSGALVVVLVAVALVVWSVRPTTIASVTRQSVRLVLLGWPGAPPSFAPCGRQGRLSH